MVLSRIGFVFTHHLIDAAARHHENTKRVNDARAESVLQGVLECVRGKAEHRDQYKVSPERVEQVDRTESCQQRESIEHILLSRVDKQQVKIDLHQKHQHQC